jgi:Regulator of ribonuclease activity B/Family of unknown function (DUF695)
MAWWTGVALVNGKPTALTFDADRPEPLPGYTQRVLVNVTVADPDGNGFHSPEEGALLNALGDAMVEAAGDDAVVVGRITGDGVRAFLAYARDTAWVDPWIIQARESVAPRTVTYAIDEQPDWRTFAALLPHAQRGHADQTVFLQLQEAGADMAQEREINWFLLFPDEATAATAEEPLRELGYGVEIHRDSRGDGDENGDRWTVTASRVAVVSLGYVVEGSAWFTAFAANHGAGFDGWGAAVTPAAS